MRTRLLAMTLWFAGLAPAQNSPSQAPAQSQSPALQAELKQLAAAAQSLQHDLPSFACKETALSQTVKKNKVKAQARFAGDLRVQRGEDGRLDENLQVTEVNGKPYSGGAFNPPVMVEGGFDQSLDFFLPSRQTCFHYSLSPGRIDFTSPPGTFDRRECSETGAPQGFALFDGAGNVTHIERQVPAEFARQVHVVNFTAIDFVSTELGGRMYPLPAKMTAGVAREDDLTLHFEATYSGCHLFKVTSTILPDVTPVPESAPAQPHP
jgi:hypothetical protein